MPKNRIYRYNYTAIVLEYQYYRIFNLSSEKGSLSLKGKSA